MTRTLRESLIDDRLAMAVVESAGQLWHLLPEAELAAGVGSEDSPSLIAVTGESLLTVTVKPGTDDAPATVCVHRQHLSPDQAIVRLEEQLLHKPAAVVRHRSWTFLLTPDSDPLTITTVQKLHGGFPDEHQPPTSERLARVLANRLGYPIDLNDSAG